MRGEIPQSNDLSSFYRVFLETIATFKDNSFREEEEFRLISEPQEIVRTTDARPTLNNHTFDTPYPPKWRAQGSMFIPYTKIALSNLDSEKLEKRHPRLSPQEKGQMRLPLSDSEWMYGEYPFRRIVVGPSTHQGLTVEALQGYLDENMRVKGHGLDVTSQIRADPSTIPYRAK